MRPDRGVLGTELRGGESSGFRRVDTWRPLFTELSVSESID